MHVVGLQEQIARLGCLVERKKCSLKWHKQTMEKYSDIQARMKFEITNV